MNALNNGSSQGGRQYADMEYEIKKLQDENSTMKKMLGVTVGFSSRVYHKISFLATDVP